MHMYIQLDMDFLDISSLGVAYRNVVKFEQNLKKNNKLDFGSANQQHKLGKSGPNSQPKGQSKEGKVSITITIQRGKRVTRIEEGHWKVVRVP